MRNNNAMTTTTFNDLPQDLITTILLRLPVKTLLLSRSVSKTWLSLISDPSFAKLHFETAAAPTNRCLSLITNNLALSYDLDGAVLHEALKLSSLPFRDGSVGIDVVGSCRGFVLLHQYPSMIIWNPSTGAQKQILYSDLMAAISCQWSMIGSSISLCGFGYDSSKDDYLVVWHWKEYSYLFSVRANSWINLEVSVPKTLNVRGFGVFLNGAFHWLVCNNNIDSEDFCYCYILVFDLKKNCFSEISLPRRMSITDSGSIVDLGGCLGVHYCNEIWVLKNYLSLSWVLAGTPSRGSFRPLGLSNNGDIVGFDGRTRGFCKHDDEYCSVQQFSIGVGGYTVYTESFLSLPD